MGKEACFLDLATGTADVALEAHRQAGSGARIFGVDFAYPMLARGKSEGREAGRFALPDSRETV